MKTKSISLAAGVIAILAAFSTTSALAADSGLVSVKFTAQEEQQGDAAAEPVLIFADACGNVCTRNETLAAKLTLSIPELGVNNMVLTGKVAQNSTLDGNSSGSVWGTVELSAGNEVVFAGLVNGKRACPASASPSEAHDAVLLVGEFVAGALKNVVLRGTAEYAAGGNPVQQVAWSGDAIAPKGLIPAPVVTPAVAPVIFTGASPYFPDYLPDRFETDIVLHCATPGATIMFRVNGSGWMPASDGYVLPLYPGNTIEAYARKAGHTDSPINAYTNMP